MKKPITGPLYLLKFQAWQENLCHIHSDFYMARVTCAPYYVIGRPAWPSTEDRERWIAKTEAISLDESELNADTRSKIAQHELLDVSR